MDLGRTIKELRKERSEDLSQKDFAKKVGLSQSHLSQIENNKKEPSLKMLRDIAAELCMPLPILFWFTLEDSDMDKRAQYGFFSKLKPALDKTISAIYL